MMITALKVPSMKRDHEKNIQRITLVYVPLIRTYFQPPKQMEIKTIFKSKNSKYLAELTIHQALFQGPHILYY